MNYYESVRIQNVWTQKNIKLSNIEGFAVYQVMSYLCKCQERDPEICTFMRIIGEWGKTFG
jgi:rRNA maturation endonuclease Nob1